jgi:Domain of unknown function (DUF4410)
MKTRLMSKLQSWWMLTIISFVAFTMATAYVDNPLSAHVEVSGVQNYSGKPLPKPSKILVYDFAVSPEDVQVDKSQQIRPRHLITGDKNPQKVGDDAADELAKELVKSLKKTGIPVERAKDSVTLPADALVIKGEFLAVKEGDKVQRVALGMGPGSAEVKTKVEVNLGQTNDPVKVSTFQTDTTVSENVGAGAPIAAGVDPAAAVAKSTVSDRKKTVKAYASKTADAAAKQITSTMAELGWIKVDSKGDVVP